MAPTICSEKVFRSRRNRVRESILKQSQNNNNSNYAAGKIIHRRSIAARNAKSIKFSLVNSFENDTTMYESNIINNNNHQNIKHSDNLLSIRNNGNYNNEFDENYNMNVIINDNTISSSLSSTTSSYSYNCDRLTPNQFYNTNLTEINKNNNNNIYSYQKQSRFIYHNDSIFYDTSQSSISTTRNSFNCIPEITSTVCIGDSNDMKINKKNVIHKKQHEIISDKKHNIIKTSTNSKGLVDIALKTITLIRRNQLLQKKLLQLQVETKEFIKSVMANPENRILCNKQLNEQSSNLQNDNNNINKNVIN